MEKLIFVDENHNGNAIKGVAAGVDADDVVVLSQLEAAVGGLTVIDPGAGLTGDTTTSPGTNIVAVGAGAHIVVDTDAVAVDTATLAADATFLTALALNPGFRTPVTDIARAAITVTGGVGVGAVEGPDGTWTVSATYKDVAEPTLATDAANKAYVDQMASGIAPLAAVRAATTEPVDLAALIAVDGVTLADGDRVLVKDQLDSVNNGIYVVTGGVAARAGDADEEGELRIGSQVFVSEGATNDNASFSVSSVGGDGAAPWTPGTDPNVWVLASQIAGYQAGDGVALTGSTFSVDVDGTSVGLIGSSPLKKVSVVVDPAGGIEAGPAGLRVAGSGATGGNGEVISGARVVTGVVTAAGTGNETLTFVHNLNVPNPAVSVQVDGCNVRVDVCRPDANTVTIGLSQAPVGTEFTVTVTG